jgi:hypothetical protein
MERILTSSEQRPEFGDEVDMGTLLRAMQCARRLSLAIKCDPTKDQFDIDRATVAHDAIHMAITVYLDTAIVEVMSHA